MNLDRYRYDYPPLTAEEQKTLMIRAIEWAIKQKERELDSLKTQLRALSSVG